jgi:hypothetical protein
MEAAAPHSWEWLEERKESVFQHQGAQTSELSHTKLATRSAFFTNMPGQIKQTTSESTGPTYHTQDGPTSMLLPMSRANRSVYHMMLGNN